jgi:hypothetical protein
MLFYPITDNLTLPNSHNDWDYQLFVTITDRRVFCILWDADHDLRVLNAVDNLIANGVNSIVIAGERKGHFAAVYLPKDSLIAPTMGALESLINYGRDQDTWGPCVHSANDLTGCPVSLADYSYLITKIQAAQKGYDNGEK